MSVRPDHPGVDVPGPAAQSIAGDWRSRMRNRIAVVSPATKDVVARLPEPTIADAEAAFAAARIDAPSRAWEFEPGAVLQYGGRPRR